METCGSSKQQIRKLIRDAICVLCQNAVAHSIQMKIEAVIGITVDDEADVVLVSINELFDKSSPGTSDVSSNVAVDKSIEVADKNVINIDDGDDCSYQETNNVSYRSQLSSAKERSASSKYNSMATATYNAVKTEPYSAVDNMSAGGSDSYDNYGIPAVRKEPHGMATVSSTPRKRPIKRQKTSNSDVLEHAYDPQMNTVDEFDAFSHEYEDGRLELSNLDECYVGDDGYTNDYNDDYDDSQYYENTDEFNSMSHSCASANRGGPSSYRKKNIALAGRRRTPKKCSTMDGAVKQEHLTNADQWQEGAVDEVSHVTIYTCSKCGVQMTNKSSLARHKRAHEGIVYRCDGCGKVVARADTLVAHRRRCPAALQQEAAEDQFA